MGFLWGAATSSHQIEGYNDKNDWWAWEAEGNVEGGVRSGPATDHWNRFREDIRLAADLGLNAYRFSIEWSRIEPEEGRWDLTAIDWYRELLGECQRFGIAPMATLHHFTSPRWFSEEGGFTWEWSSAKFSRYVKTLVQALDFKVPYWCTFNEPMVLVAGSYLGQFMPPAVVSPRMASLACHNILKAHATAYDILHAENRTRVQVGIAHNMVDFVADRDWHPLENALAWVFHRFYNKAWLDAVTGRAQKFGIPGFIPNAPHVAEAAGRLTADFIGVNYYTKGYVQWRPRVPPHDRSSMPFPFNLAFAQRKDVVSDLGWAMHPRGFQRMLKLAGSYGLPVFVTENGIADREDALRSDFLVEHLGEVAKAIEKGVDVRGYFHWSLLDNFEWIKGFGPRFGLYHVDYETFERTLRPSADLYRKIIAKHREGEGEHLSPRRERLRFTDRC
jgi:beta-glucosidase